MTSSNLPAIIRSVVDIYKNKGINVRDIGNGWCEEFSDDVLLHWIGENWIFQDGVGFSQVETGNFVVRDGSLVLDWDWSLLSKHWNITPPQGVPIKKLKLLAWREPNHIWIAYQGRHYDAESPDGVNSFFDLKFFRRWLDLESK